MKTTNQVPQKCQFVAIWEHDDRVWSGVFVRDEDGTLLQYSPHEDDFMPSSANYDTVFENAVFVTEL